jgi:hypothetical protein
VVSRRPSWKKSWCASWEEHRKWSYDAPRDGGHPPTQEFGLVSSLGFRPARSYAKVVAGGPCHQAVLS